MLEAPPERPQVVDRPIPLLRVVAQRLVGEAPQRLGESALEGSPRQVGDLHRGAALIQAQAQHDGGVSVGEQRAAGGRVRDDVVIAPGGRSAPQDLAEVAVVGENEQLPVGELVGQQARQALAVVGVEAVDHVVEDEHAPIGVVLLQASQHEREPKRAELRAAHHPLRRTDVVVTRVEREHELDLPAATRSVHEANIAIGARPDQPGVEGRREIAQIGDRGRDGALDLLVGELEHALGGPLHLGGGTTLALGGLQALALLAQLGQLDERRRPNVGPRVRRLPAQRR